MQRRDFVRGSVASAAFAIGSSFLRRAAAAPAQPGPSPYGPISDTPDANGLRLPSGFSSRVIAVTGFLVPNTSHTWHPAPDGGACFAEPNGGWAYVSNAELPLVG